MNVRSSRQKKQKASFFCQIIGFGISIGFNCAIWSIFGIQKNYVPSESLDRSNVHSFSLLIYKSVLKTLPAFQNKFKRKKDFLKYTKYVKNLLYFISKNLFEL